MTTLTVVAGLYRRGDVLEFHDGTSWLVLDTRGQNATVAPNRWWRRWRMRAWDRLRGYRSAPLRARL